MFTPLHSSMNQELFEKHVCNTVATMKNTMVPRPPIFSETEVSIPIAFFCQLCLIRYTAVRIKKCSKSTSVIKIVTMKNTDDCSLHATTKLTLFTVSKDEWNSKEDTGKSLKNALHVLQCAKRHLSGRSDVEQ